MVRRDGIRLWTALWIVYLAWGSTYVAIKLAVRTLPPLLTAGTRFLAASAILAGVAVLLRRSLRVERREALAAAGVGVALLSLGVGLVHVAETRIDSGVAAMIAGSVPLQIVVWRLAAGERVPAADDPRGARRARRASRSWWDRTASRAARPRSACS